MKRIILAVTTLFLALNVFAQEPTFVFSKTGVGPLKAGVKLVQSNKCTLPASVKGLYDSIDLDTNQFDGMYEIRCIKDDAATLIIVCDEANKAEKFAVLSPNCKTAEGFSVESTAAEIIAAGGVDKTTKLVDGKMVTWYYSLYLGGVYYLFKSSDGVNGKIKSDAKPIGLSNFKYAILDLELMQ